MFDYMHAAHAAAAKSSKRQCQRGRNQRRLCNKHTAVLQVHPACT